MKQDRLLGRSEAAAFLGISPRTLYQLVTRAEIPVARIGRVLKFDPESLAAWMELRTQNAPQPMPEPLNVPHVDLRDLDDRPVEQRLLAALLAEQREVRRLLVRITNCLAGRRP